MRICYLAAADSIHSARWITFFRDHGHEVRWISLVPRTDAVRDIIPIVEITAPGFKPVRMARAVHAARRLLRAWRPDVLHAHYAGAYGIVAALSGFHPYVLTPWGSDVLIAARSPLVRPFVRLALRRADLITVDAQHMADAVAGFGVPRERVHLVYFGTDTEMFRPDARSEGVRRQIGAPLVISLRSFEPVYDVATLIRSVAAVVRAVPAARFLLIGRGTQEAALKDLSNSLGVSDHVVFLGHVPARQLPQYLASSDVYVSTALSDAGLAASTAEAMACGLPVIVTDSGENRLWVRDGENGYVVPTTSPEILAERIVDLLRRPDVRAEWGQANRQVIVERNNYAREMRRMEEIYHALTAGHGHAPVHGRSR
jgi:glycosyltransferase involved in cell wall biosynthesis